MSTVGLAMSCSTQKWTTTWCTEGTDDVKLIDTTCSAHLRGSSTPSWRRRRRKWEGPLRCFFLFCFDWFGCVCFFLSETECWVVTLCLQYLIAMPRPPTHTHTRTVEMSCQQYIYKKESLVSFGAALWAYWLLVRFRHTQRHHISRPSDLWPLTPNWIGPTVRPDLYSPEDFQIN